jgi:hypothetical protein
MAAWIRICILNADQGDLKRAKKKEGNNASKMQIIRHKRDKKQCTGNWFKMGKWSVTFLSSF